MRRFWLVSVFMITAYPAFCESGNYPAGDNYASVSAIEVVDGWVGFIIDGQYFALDTAGININPEKSFKNMYAALLYAKSTNTKIKVSWANSKEKWGRTYKFVQIIYIP